MSQLEPGRRLGRYQIVRPLGSGAMGDVYLAEDPQIERPLAIKTVRLEASRPADVEERKQRLLREAKAAGRLLHPYIVTLFDAGEEGELVFLAFEYVAGADLEARLREGAPLSLEEALRVVRQTAEGLAYAHQHGVVHRDIKPSNILLSADGSVKISDFGIAKITGETSGLTMTGSVVGSPHYLSPEQIRGEPLDGRSDIFSLGVVFYELLSGRRPFDGESLTTLVYQILHRPLPALLDRRPGPVPEVEEILGRMLAKDREERYQEAAQVAVEVAELPGRLAPELLSGPAQIDAGAYDPTLALPSDQIQPVPQEPVPAPPSAPAGRRSSTPWILAAAAMLLVLLLGVGVLGWLFVAPRAGEWISRWSGVVPSAGEAPAVVEPAPDFPPAPVAEPDPGEAPDTRQGELPADEVPASPPPREEPRIAPQEETPAPVRRQPDPGPPAAPEEPTRRLMEERAPAVTPDARPEIAPAEPAPEEVAPEPEPVVQEPPRSRRPEVEVDRELEVGTRVNFDVTPSDAYVLLEGTVIGQARDLNERQGGRAFDLPGEGTYLVTFRKVGMEDVHVRLRASRGRPAPEVVSGRLDRLPADDIPLGDLTRVRVREAVGFRVRPVDAEILVDGRAVGSTSRYSGSALRGDSWLELPIGTHRISLLADGYERRDVAVEVSGGARDRRQRIEVVLAPEG